MKVCIRCQKPNPLSEYYVHAKMGDGHLSVCKSCVKERVHKRELKLRKDPEWVDQEKTRAREKYHRLYSGIKYPKTNEEQRRYRAKYPEKNRAKALANALPCPKGYHRHHWSYNIEHYLDVILLHPKLHYKLHRYMKYRRDKKMYATLDGTLLDTRKKHLSYIRMIKKLP
jgi:hypothetical protein